MPPGSAVAVGNESGTQHGQSLTVSPGADPTIAGMGAAEANAGGAVANTGVNSGEGVTIQPGNATAHGNQATSTVSQAGASSATGGGVTLLGQEALALSAGGAYADTGFNADGDGITTGDASAWGARSGNSVLQDANAADSGGTLRVIGQSAGVSNLGLGVAETGVNTGDTIESGSATGGGSEANAGVEQAAESVGVPTSPPVVSQGARTSSAGAGIANSGGNSATGDDSTNDPE
jgi:hypothetical protein